MLLASHTIQVEAFVLEGISVSGTDKRTLNLPTSDKITRTKVSVALLARSPVYTLVVHVLCRASQPREEHGVVFGRLNQT